MIWHKLIKPKRSRVEISGLEARYYDQMLDLVSLGRYKKLIGKIIAAMEIQPGFRVLDLGCGTGRNAELMARYLGSSGEVLGLDIGAEMLEAAQKRAAKNPLLKFEKASILTPLPYQNEFDRVTIAFVLHGFEQPERLRIVDTAYQALKPDGIFYIVDWNEFDPKQLSALSSFAFHNIECQLASEFITYPWKSILAEKGFEFYSERFFVRNYLRLLGLKKARVFLY